MSFMDKIKSWFSGGSSADEHAGHDHSGHDHAAHDHIHEPEPVAPPMPPADPMGMPTGQPPAEGESRNE